MIYLLFALLVIVPLVFQLALCNRARRKFYRHSLWILALIPVGYAINEHLNGTSDVSGVTVIIYLAIAAEMLIGIALAWLIYFAERKLEKSQIAAGTTDVTPKEQ